MLKILLFEFISLPSDLIFLIARWSSVSSVSGLSLFFFAFGLTYVICIFLVFSFWPRAPEPVILSPCRRSKLGNWRKKERTWEASPANLRDMEKGIRIEIESPATMTTTGASRARNWRLARGRHCRLDPREARKFQVYYQRLWHGYQGRWEREICFQSNYGLLPISQKIMVDVGIVQIRRWLIKEIISNISKERFSKYLVEINFEYPYIVIK